MSKYPLARWSVRAGHVGASVHTRLIPEGGGGGYFLYEYKSGDPHIAVTELVEGTTLEERQDGKRSEYVELGRIPVSDAVQEMAPRKQELPVARLIFTDMRERFGEIESWIPYDSLGRPVWFHEEVTGV